MEEKIRQALMNFKPKKNMSGEPKTIQQQLEAIAEAMCNDYCRYPLTWNEEVDGELADSEICANCPLNKLT